ncbi:glycerol-3-phosphate acyltransferase [Sporosarcina sp. CAU 1771]
MIFLLIVGSYFLGNLLTGSLVSQLFQGKGITEEGSGNPGARNIGRLFGKKAFILTFIGDAVKGALPIIVVRLAGFESLLEFIVLLAVVVGHIYPVLFSFRGGKGVSTFLGGLLVINPFIIGPLIGAFLLLYPFVKSFTIAGLGAISIVPICLLLLSYGLPTVLIACVLIGLILFAHRTNIKEKRSLGKA